jgi:GT2 family glycosyltransferase
MPVLLVVVPVYSHWEYAVRTVASLYRAADASCFESSADVACVVLDDGSPDYSPLWEQRLLDIDPRVSFLRYPDNRGMTRSWNAGLKLARAGGNVWCCLANSDLLFTPGWDAHLRLAGNEYALTGPVSNAPGHTSKVQDVGVYLPDYVLSDEWGALKTVADDLGSRGLSPVPARVNGFCMMTRTEVAWAHPFNADHVLDPRCPMAGNEDRLQDRWAKAGLRFAVCPASFVFHYRSVTRGDRFRKGRWMRAADDTPQG